MSPAERAAELQTQGTPLETIARTLTAEGYAGLWTSKDVAKLLAQRALERSMAPGRVRELREREAFRANGGRRGR